MDTQILSGISSAKLHKLEVRNANGVFQDILTLIGTGGSGGTVTGVLLPLTINSGTIETLFLPSTVSAGAGIVANANDASGALSLDLNFLEERDRVKMKDGVVVKEITMNTAGNLLWGGVIIPDMNILGQQLGNYVQSSYLTSQLALKQNILFPTSGLSIVGSNISVNEATDVRSQFHISNSGGQAKTLQHSLTGALMWGTSAIPDLNYLTTQLNTKQNTLSSANAGTGITITNSVITATGGGGSATTLQLNGVTQTAHVLNFNGLVSGGTNAANNVLNIEPRLSTISQSIPAPIRRLTH